MVPKVLPFLSRYELTDIKRPRNGKQGEDSFEPAL